LSSVRQAFAARTMVSCAQAFARAQHKPVLQAKIEFREG
jgi:hypothetical protein